MRAVLNLPTFRRLWSAGLLSTGGTEISRLAVVLYLARDQQSGAAVALWIALRAMPGIVASPWTGVLVDRVNPRTLMIAMDLLRAALLLIVAAALHPWLIFVVAAVESIAQSLFEPARRAAVPRFVRSDLLEQANAIDQASNTVVLIVCPVAGAHLFLRYGLPIALVIDALSFLASAALLVGIALPSAPGASGSKRTWNLRDLAESWRAATEDVRIRVIVAVQLVSLICTGLWAPVAPFFIRDVLGASDVQLGWQFSAFGLGGALGAVFAPRLAGIWPAGRLLMGALLLEGVHMVAYALTPDWRLSLVWIFGWGVTVALIAIASASYLQRTVSGALLGRVFTLTRQAEQIGLLVSMGLAAWLSPRMRPEILLAMGGLVYVVAAVIAAAIPGGRRVWRPTPPVTSRSAPTPGAPGVAAPAE